MAAKLASCNGSLFFFSSRRRHTRLVSDWSSDVCSSDLTKRILTAEEVLKAIALEPDFANQVLLRFVYDTGVRVSELVAIAWSDFRRGTNGTRVTVIGKDNAERTILLHPEMWRQLEILRELTDGQPRDRPFGVSAETVRKTVLAATTRAGIDKAVSTHWLRQIGRAHV